MKLALLAIIGFCIVIGFAALKTLAAREVSGGETGAFLRALMWTGWMRGASPKARLLRNLAIIWLGTAALAWILVAILVE